MVSDSKCNKGSHFSEKSNGSIKIKTSGCLRSTIFLFQFSCKTLKRLKPTIWPYILKQTRSFQLLVCLSRHDLSADTRSQKLI